MKYLFLPFFIVVTFAFLSGQDCEKGAERAVLHANKVIAPLDTDGSFFSTLGYDDFDSYRVEHDDDPETKPSMIISGALWLVGIDPEDSIKVAANRHSTYRDSDYTPGPLRTDGTTDSLTCAKWDRFFPITQAEVEALRADLADDGEVNEPLSTDLLGWPGRGNPHFASVHGFSLPDQELAPFIDYDGDGAYDPEKGDFPLIKGDQAFWWVFNDLSPVLPWKELTGITMEVQMMAYASAAPGSVIDYTTFFEVKCINRGQEDFLDSYVGLWMYPDVGCSLDDAYRSNPDYDLAFTYNAPPEDFVVCNARDQVYGPEYSPVQGVKVVGSFQEELQEPAGLHSFIAFDSGQCDGDPGQYGPGNAQQYYNTIRGLWIDGLPIVVGNRGYYVRGIPVTTKFLYNDLDLPGGQPWLSGRAICMSDQVLSVGPYNLKPGAFSLTTFAAFSTFGLPFDTLGVPNFDTVYTDATTVQDYYDAKTEECRALIRDLTATSVTEEQMTENLVASFPNPVTHTLHLRAVAQEQLNTVQIFSPNGQLVQHFTARNTAADIDVGNLQAGLYLARVVCTSGKAEVIRFVKQ